MLNKELIVLETLNKYSSINQRDISKKTGISIGKINSIIKFLASENFINIEGSPRKLNYKITDKGMEALEISIKNNIERKISLPTEGKKDIKQAVILAAGEKNSFEKPIGLMSLGESTVIERIINILKNNGVKEIVLITGYEGSKYETIQNDYIRLIRNDNYKWTGTMESLSLANKYIVDDFILIEADMVFEERAVKEVLGCSNRNCVLITSDIGSGDEVFVELKSDFIFKISKDKHQFNRIDGQMIGVSKISIDIYNKMLEEFSCNKNPFFNYEYALMDVARTYDIGYVKLENLIWTEIHTIWQYKNLLNYIYPVLIKKEQN